MRRYKYIKKKQYIVLRNYKYEKNKQFSKYWLNVGFLYKFLIKNHHDMQLVKCPLQDKNPSDIIKDSRIYFYYANS